MTLKELRAKLARKASRAVLGGFRPPDDPLTSWFGKVCVALPGEDWPESAGNPMQPLLQVNLSELPWRPDLLADIAMITVFVDAENLPSGSSNGDKWLLRAYKTLVGLAPVEDPVHRRTVKPFPLRWETIEADYPTWDYAVEMDIPARYEDDFSERFPTQEGTKIGGWPFTVQSEIYWAPFNKHPANPEYVFQIDSVEKARWSWGDMGVGYFGRGTGDACDVWTFEWQCL